MSPCVGEGRGAITGVLWALKLWYAPGYSGQYDCGAAGWVPARGSISDRRGIVRHVSPPPPPPPPPLSGGHRRGGNLPAERRDPPRAPFQSTTLTRAEITHPVAEAGWQPKGQLFQFVWASYGWLVPKVWIERNAVAQVFGWSVNGWQIDSGERCVLLPLFVWPPAAAFRVRHQLFAPSRSPSLFPLLPTLSLSPPPPPPPAYRPLSLPGSGQRVRGQNTDKVKCFCPIVCGKEQYQTPEKEHLRFQPFSSALQSVQKELY